MSTQKDNLARLTLTQRAQGCGSRSDRALAESLRCPGDWQGAHANARLRLVRGSRFLPPGALVPTGLTPFTCTDLLAVAVGAEGSLSALGASLGFSTTLESL